MPQKQCLLGRTLLSRSGIKAVNISATDADFPAAWPWPKTVSISCAKTFTRLLPAQGIGGAAGGWGGPREAGENTRRMHGKENKSI